MIVAIHQPNYLPWLGYFAKIAQANIFVFLDDAQFSKGSYTNRVHIARNGAPVWLTVPIRHDFEAPICEIEIARPDWARAHRDALHQAYRHAAAFPQVWPLIEEWLADGQPAGLAQTNMRLIEAVASRLVLTARFERSSALPVAAAGEADARLAAIAARLAPGGVYLSGAGGANYQAESVFQEAGIRLAYSGFVPMPYERSGEDFLKGLSVLDALFHLGFERTAELVRFRP